MSDICLRNLILIHLPEKSNALEPLITSSAVCKEKFLLVIWELANIEASKLDDSKKSRRGKKKLKSYLLFLSFLSGLIILFLCRCDRSHLSLCPCLHLVSGSPPGHIHKRILDCRDQPQHPHYPLSVGETVTWPSML